MSTVKVGQRVKMDGRTEIGVVRYVGPVQGVPGPMWVGVELAVATGKNDGSVKGNVYFKCKPNHGVFVAPTAVTVVPPKRQAAVPSPAGAGASALKPPSTTASSPVKSRAPGVKTPGSPVSTGRLSRTGVGSPKKAPQVPSSNAGRPPASVKQGSGTAGKPTRTGASSSVRSVLSPPSPKGVPSAATTTVPSSLSRRSPAVPATGGAAAATSPKSGPPKPTAPSEPVRTGTVEDLERTANHLRQAADQLKADVKRSQAGELERERGREQAASGGGGSSSEVDGEGQSDLHQRDSAHVQHQQHELRQRELALEHREQALLVRETTVQRREQTLAEQQQQLATAKQALQSSKEPAPGPSESETSRTSAEVAELRLQLESVQADAQSRIAEVQAAASAKDAELDALRQELTVARSTPPEHAQVADAASVLEQRALRAETALTDAKEEAELATLDAALAREQLRVAQRQASQAVAEAASATARAPPSVDENHRLRLAVAVLKESAAAAAQGRTEALRLAEDRARAASDAMERAAEADAAVSTLKMRANEGERAKATAVELAARNAQLEAVAAAAAADAADADALLAVARELEQALELSQRAVEDRARLAETRTQQVLAALVAERRRASATAARVPELQARCTALQTALVAAGVRNSADSSGSAGSLQPGGRQLAAQLAVARAINAEERASCADRLRMLTGLVPSAVLERVAPVAVCAAVLHRVDAAASSLRALASGPLQALRAVLAPSSSQTGVQSSFTSKEIAMAAQCDCLGRQLRAASVTVRWLLASPVDHPLLHEDAGLVSALVSMAGRLGSQCVDPVAVSGVDVLADAEGPVNTASSALVCLLECIWKCSQGTGTLAHGAVAAKELESGQPGPALFAAVEHCVPWAGLVLRVTSPVLLRVRLLVSQLSGGAKSGGPDRSSESLATASRALLTVSELADAVDSCLRSFPVHGREHALLSSGDNGGDLKPGARPFLEPIIAVTGGAPTAADVGSSPAGAPTETVVGELNKLLACSVRALAEDGPVLAAQAERATSVVLAMSSPVTEPITLAAEHRRRAAHSDMFDREQQALADTDRARADAAAAISLASDAQAEAASLRQRLSEKQWEATELPSKLAAARERAVSAESTANRALAEAKRLKAMVANDALVGEGAGPGSGDADSAAGGLDPEQGHGHSSSGGTGDDANAVEAVSGPQSLGQLRRRRRRRFFVASLFDDDELGMYPLVGDPGAPENDDGDDDDDWFADDEGAAGTGTGASAAFGGSGSAANGAGWASMASRRAGARRLRQLSRVLYAENARLRLADGARRLSSLPLLPSRSGRVGRRVAAGHPSPAVLGSVAAVLDDTRRRQAAIQVVSLASPPATSVDGGSDDQRTGPGPGPPPSLQLHWRRVELAALAARLGAATQRLSESCLLATPFNSTSAPNKPVYTKIY